MKPKLSIIVPSIGRHDFLNRIQNYYNGSNFNVIIQNYPNKTVKQCMIDGNLKINTPYAVFCGDDDLIIPSGANAAMDFLDTNREYIACNGNAELFKTHDDTPYGKVAAITPYRLLGLEYDLSCNRINVLHQNYFVNIFSIHRTGPWLEMWAKRSDEVEANNSLDTELVPVYLSAFLGKTKHLNIPYLKRQVHARRVLVTKDLRPSEQFIKRTLRNYGIDIPDRLPNKKISFLEQKKNNLLSKFRASIRGKDYIQN